MIPFRSTRYIRHLDTYFFFFFFQKSSILNSSDILKHVSTLKETRSTFNTCFLLTHVRQTVSDTGSPRDEVEEDDDASQDLLDMATFDQLLDMDDEEDHEFSKSIVWDYFKQAEATFEDMDGAL